MSRDIFEVQFCGIYSVSNSFILYRYCGIKDPSWAEVRHFISFLDLQLHLCEKSYFTKEDFVGDVLTGFKSFVVKFMIQMSRVSLADFASLIFFQSCFRIFPHRH